jgi:hypothetical protein
MDANVGKIDKILRMGIGGTLIVMGLPGVMTGVSPVIRYVCIGVGAYLFLSGVAGRCIFYKMAGISTNKPEASEDDDIKL